MKEAGCNWGYVTRCGVHTNEATHPSCQRVRLFYKRPPDGPQWPSVTPEKKLGCYENDIPQHKDSLFSWWAAKSPPTPCPSTTHPDIRSLRKRIHLQFCDTSGTANKRRRPTHEAKCWVLFVYLWWAPEVFVCLASPALAQHERNSALVTLTSFAAGWRAELFKSSSAVIIGSLGSFIQQVASVESVMCPQVQLEFELVMFAQWPLQYSAGRMHAYLIIYWLIYCFVAVINIECAVKCWRMWKGWVSKADQDQAMLCSWKSVPFSWFGGNP